MFKSAEGFSFGGFFLFLFKMKRSFYLIQNNKTVLKTFSERLIIYIFFISMDGLKIYPYNIFCSDDGRIKIHPYNIFRSDGTLITFNL
ncbi:hypothetical protein B0A80_09505 [Flavobacterium tructae]|nr:hypothetical protein B0A80_09505 [Flavobacterium tructae]